MIGEFHFLRPWAFLAIVPAILLLLLIRRRQDAGRAWRGIIAPHLLPYLLSRENQRTRSVPLTLLAIGWMVSIFALAGPTWRREPSPFADDIAALAIVLKVTPSMRAQDIQPDRLTKSVQKIQDLLVLRRGAKTSLIAYSRSAHVVMPLTIDENIVNTFARALDPKIMPSDGDSVAEALRLADQTLTGAGAGSIVWIADNVAPEEERSLAAWRKSSRTPLRLLMPLSEGPEMAALQEAANVAGASPVKLTADNADVNQLARTTKFSSIATAEKSDRWEESGYWLVLILALLMLPFSRRGWMVSTAARSMIAKYLRIRLLVVAFLLTAVPWLVNSVEAQEANARTKLILKGDPWVGQRVALVVELLVPGFFSGSPHFDLPSVPEALLVSPSESPVLGSQQIQGVSFTVQRHEFSIFPHKAGEYRIPAFVVRLKFKPSPLDKEVISKTVHSDPVSFTAHFPPGTENLTGLLSAKQLQVTEKWQPSRVKPKQVTPLLAPFALLLPKFRPWHSLRFLPPRSKDSASIERSRRYSIKASGVNCKAKGATPSPMFASEPAILSFLPYGSPGGTWIRDGFARLNFRAVN